MENKNLEYYLGLKYAIRLIPYDDGSYYVDIPDLPGCMTEGKSLEDAMAMIEDAKRAWLEATLESGMNVPLPSTEREYSGKLVIRIPKTLHSSLSETAEKEGVSLNQYINHILSHYDGGICVERVVSERLEKTQFRYFDAFIDGIANFNEKTNYQKEHRITGRSKENIYLIGGKEGFAA